MASWGQDKEYKTANFIQSGDTLLYRVLYPKDFSENKQYPLIFFLHGAGERGNDNEKQLVHGSSLFTDEEVRNRFPVIVVFPQCPEEDYWSNVSIDRSKTPIELVFNYKKPPTNAMKSLMGLMDDVMEKQFVAKNQVYVMGLSMGGMGTFEVLYRKPSTFAAAIAICGGGWPQGASCFWDTPIWLFHGADDNVVHPQLSLDMASEILHYGGSPKMTLYDNTGHNSWDPAFADPSLLPWLFSKQRKQ
ncbi:prolyl oligopeptidase family serine peptidase [Maribacter sp. 2307ULW6-5]|uniref:carboxylesterase family protein n=1 Tax=Maribacter sp. 2307ULW6-5 TaxID=3386275 RepID=UPI0039BC4B6A